MTKFFEVGAKLVTIKSKLINEKHMFTILHGNRSRPAGEDATD